VVVPNVVGLTQSAATAAITGANLVVGTVTQQSSASVPAGNVISQSPLAAASVAPGSAVSLVVSTGPAVDTQPPSAPLNLSGTSSNTQVHLAWQSSTDNVGVVGYIIYRSKKAGVLGPQVATTSSTEWIDTAVAVADKFTYAIKAYDAAGNVSARSNWERVTVR